MQYQLAYIVLATTYQMTFEVREFDFQAGEDFIWKFKLSNINSSQLDFYSQEASVRSLLHLAKDFSTQIDQALEKKLKREEEKNRTIRKLTEKIIKSLQINLQSFAHDIKESLTTIQQFFKNEVEETESKDRIQLKCKQWVIATWNIIQCLDLFHNYRLVIQLSLSPDSFYKSTDRYMKSYIKDGKRLNPDFQMLNELYLVTTGDNFKQSEENTQPHSDTLVLVDINLNVEEKYISESFLWDSQDISNVRIKTFATHFLRDTLAENEIQLEKDAYTQLQKEVKIQIRAQILYKTLLKKYASILLNFSAVDIPSEVKQYTIPINLKISGQNHEIIFEDSFQWDILNEHSNVQQFVEGMIEDYELPKRYFSQLCYKIRSQVNSELEWKFDLLVKTFKSIHKDRESPKLNTQTISVLRKNITYAMDVNMPCTDQKVRIEPNIYFNNSDLFSLLSKNIDILPEEFQQILLCKEQNQEKDISKLTKAESNDTLVKNGITIDNNNYLPNSVPIYTLHNLWRKSVSK